MRHTAVELRPRAVAAIALTSVAGLFAFFWPLLISPDTGLSHSGDAPLVFAAILIGVLAVVLAEVSDGGLDTKAVAMLGVLSAVGAALRPLGAGSAGLETVFFLLILAGRVFGPGFGFVLGATTLAASALITAGVGPWLPFQMLAAAWVGLGAGLLPRAKGVTEVVLLCGYGAVTGLLYGVALNFSFWPFTVQGEESLSFVAGAPVLSRRIHDPLHPQRSVVWLNDRVPRKLDWLSLAALSDAFFPRGRCPSSRALRSPRTSPDSWPSPSRPPSAGTSAGP